MRLRVGWQRLKPCALAVPTQARLARCHHVSGFAGWYHRAAPSSRRREFIREKQASPPPRSTDYLKPWCGSNSRFQVSGIRDQEGSASRKQEASGRAARKVIDL